ncbi:MAG TPA: hypothetical protein VH186_35050 [Chloroflexia bacterium]|nr:hypothetical protein [Chloroflexia bacterium]
MRDTLSSLDVSLQALTVSHSSELLEKVNRWKEKLLPQKYSCLGCAYCFPAVAQNMLQQAFPPGLEFSGLGCSLEITRKEWPQVAGDYLVSDKGENSLVAVSTLANPDLAGLVAAKKPKGLSIIGKTETENIGLEKVIVNIVANPSIKYLILCGEDSPGHLPGHTLLALWENGIDAQGRVIGARAKRPFLKNITAEQATTFRKQIQIVDMIGCKDIEQIVSKITELAVRPTVELRQINSRISNRCGCSEICENDTRINLQLFHTPVVEAQNRDQLEMDRLGYFVIIPQSDKGMIQVEHYSYDNTLLHVMRGDNDRSIYRSIIDDGWISQLSHAAYLGNELAKAALALKLGFVYVQDQPLEVKSSDIALSDRR